MWVIERVQKSTGRRPARPEDDAELVDEQTETVMEFKTLYVVGHYRPTPEGDAMFVELERCDSLKLAMREVHFLNGGAR